jgi:hypothetical protein
MTGIPFMSLSPFQWIALIVASLTLLILADAFAGHYRSGFVSRSQYLPFISGGLLIVSAVTAAVNPKVGWTNLALQLAAWLAIISGLVGFAFHHYYGIVKKPGGYKWLLHYLMYGAPQLAPVGLALMGVLGLATARGIAGRTEFVGFNLRAAVLTLTAVGVVGSVLQSGILHYRGAFNNPAMYLPLTVPLLTAVVLAWTALAPGKFTLALATVFLWPTFLIGFVGLGMHLRGFGRQMGGLYLAMFNWLEGPPAFAPGLFAGLSAIGLVATHFL